MEHVASGTASTADRRGEIGAGAAEHRVALAHLANALAAALPPAARPSVAETVELLGRRQIEVALVWQTGTGAPRILNALTGNPGMLPDEPPAKSATTIRLVLGKPGGPEAGGRFAFYDRGDWDAVLAEAGRARSGLDEAARAELRDRLEREIEEMRTRSFMRLGDQFHRLSGRGHRIDELTAASAARYIGLGEPIDGIDQVPERARYADITREAEFFLPRGAFSLPLVLIATPGIDDGFRIREERTAAAVAAADLSLVAISADRPLGRDDRAMLDWVLELSKGRAVVFLDRGREPVSGVDRRVLAQAVSRQIEQLRPGARVPVVLGCSDEADRALAALAGAGGMSDPTAALEASNLAGLTAALEEALFWGPALSVHDEAAGVLEALAEGELARISGEVMTHRARAEAPELTEAELTARAGALDTAVSAALSALDVALADLWGQIRTDAIAILKMQAAAVVENRRASAEAGAEALPMGAAPLAAALKAALSQRINSHYERLVEAISEPRQAIADIRRTGLGLVAEALPLARAMPPDLSPALRQIEAAGANEPDVASLASAGSEATAQDAQRYIAAPYHVVVERVIEDAALALRKAATDTIESDAAIARQGLGPEEEGADPREALAELEAIAEGIEELRDRIRAFRAASRPD